MNRPLNKLRKTSSKEIQSIKRKVVPTLRRYGIKKAGIFGSYVRGDQKKESDVDILVEPPRGIGFGFIGIQFELEKKLGRKVDLITYKYLNPLLKKEILESEVRII